MAESTGRETSQPRPLLTGDNWTCPHCAADFLGRYGIANAEIVTEGRGGPITAFDFRLKLSGIRITLQGYNLPP